MDIDLFAPPPPRQPDATVREEREALLALSSVSALEDYPVAVLYTNPARQIVWANAAARTLFEVGDVEDAWGLRPGEALGCVHALGASEGCGTAQFCFHCGNAHSLAAAAAGLTHEEEVVVRRDERSRSEALELRVWAKPFELRGRHFILFSASDISSQRRRETLERLFYHDIVNTTSGLRGILGILEPAPGDRNGEYLELARSASEQLVEEVESQRALQAAEDRSLRLSPFPVDASEAVGSVMDLFRYPLHHKRLRLDLAPDSSDFTIRTDRTLLRRILVNMVKNAIEASIPEDRIVIGYAATESEPGATHLGEGKMGRFWVWNRAALEERARERVFERSFSTKGQGRGYGTYGMRLLAERYLGGRVDFSSSAEAGTRFEATFPLRPESEASEDRGAP